MKCKRLLLVFLSSALAISPAFCGWSFLTPSEKSYSVSENLSQETVQEESEEVSTKVSEGVQMAEVQPVAEVPPVTPTSEEEKTNLLSSVEQNAVGISNLSTTLNELENSSMISKDKKIAEFRAELEQLKSNLQNSNLNSQSIENLLKDYDEALYNAEKEMNRIHFGIGASYGVASGDEKVYLDSYLRRQNVFLTTSVGHNLDTIDELIKPNFDFGTLDYKVGLGFEF